MATTRRARRAQQAARQKAVDSWNAANPIGTPVMIKLDGYDDPMATVTRSEAQILSGHSAVIWLEGISGCYLLDRVRAASTDEEQADAALELKHLFGPRSAA